MPNPPPTSPEPAPPPRSLRERLKSPHGWVTTTYFAEGYPYSVVHTLGDILFKEFGASLQLIGLTSLFHLPWNLKFLWGPFLDAYATKRAWLVWLEIALTAVLVALAFATTTSVVLPAAASAFVVLALLSATHDIAIDGYYLEGLDDQGQSRFVGYRAMAYKIAMLLVAGPLVMLIAAVGWFAGLLAAAGVMGLLLAYHARFLPRVETEKRPVAELARSLVRLPILAGGAALALLVAGVRAWTGTESYAALAGALAEAAPALAKIGFAEWVGIGLLVVLVGLLAALPRISRRIERSASAYAAAFVDFLAQDKVGAILAFVILFRAGESFLLKMRYPFLRDVGMTMEQYGFASGTMGVVASFAGTMLGGYLISKHGLRRWIWPFVLAQNLLNLVYVVIAFARGPVEALGPAAAMGVYTTAISLEAFGAGLGTAVFMVYLMRCCRPAFKAAHMAILTALMSVSFTLAGVASGFLAEWLGYPAYFVLSTLITVPGMALIFFIPHLDSPSA